MPNWKKMKAEYIRGASYRTLADKYGVSFSTIQKIGSREKWTDLRKKTGRKMDEKIIESAAKLEAKKVNTIQTIADKLLNMINESLDKGDWITIAPKGIKDITGAIKDIRDIKGAKSELDMQEQMARIEKLRKEAQAEEQDRDIHVVIEGSLDDFAI